MCARHAGAGSFSDSGHAQSRFPCSKLKLGKLLSHYSKLTRFAAVLGSRIACSTLKT